MKASIAFDGKLGGKREFTATLEVELHGLQGGALSLAETKELLTRIAIAITNPGGFEELARNICHAGEPYTTTPIHRRLERVK